MNPDRRDIEVINHVLDGHSDALGAAQAKIDKLEHDLREMRASLRAMLIEVAGELRDDSDFQRPYWQNGADTVAEHWWGKISRKGMVFILGTAAAGLLLWFGSLGLFGKK